MKLRSNVSTVQNPGPSLRSLGHKRGSIEVRASGTHDVLTKASSFTPRQFIPWGVPGILWLSRRCGKAEIWSKLWRHTVHISACLPLSIVSRPLSHSKATCVRTLQHGCVWTPCYTGSKGSPTAKGGLIALISSKLPPEKPHDAACNESEVLGDHVPQMQQVWDRY